MTLSSLPFLSNIFEVKYFVNIFYIKRMISKKCLTLRVVHVLLSCTSIVTPCRSRGSTSSPGITIKELKN